MVSWHRCWALLALLAFNPLGRAMGESPWREWAREVFVDFIEGIGCQDCSQLLDQETEMQFTLSSNIFGCADIDVLLPSLHWLYESRRFHDEAPSSSLPGLLVDGGANVGRATARWISSFGDSFSPQISSNPSVAPCVVCNGQSASQKQIPGLAPTPNVAVVAVEPSDSNFQLLLRHSKEHGWEHEAFLPLKAALGGARGLGHLAVSDFAIDEVATLLWEENDPRRKQEVEVITLAEVVQAAQKAFPDLAGNDKIFLLKLDIEGLEPAVLRSLGQGPPVKFVSFEYAGNVWKDRLSPVLQDLYAAGYFCFLITSEQLFPVSGPFWSNIYELPMWSNFFCGQEGDSDLESLAQLHVGAIGLWPRMAHSYLPELAEDDTQRSFLEAQHRCTDLGAACAGITCEASAASSKVAPTKCTARRGARGGVRRSPREEVSYVKEVSYSNLYLRYMREKDHQRWGVEVLLHRYFASSACRTLNPEEADLFLVPDYRACHLHLAPTYMHKGLTRIEGDDYHSQIIRNHKDKYRRPDQAENKFQELLKSLKYFDRKQGMDHIFIFSDQGFIVNFTHTFPSWRDHMAHSIFLTTEAFTPGCGPSCFSPWKDAVIPGHIDMERFQRIASYNQPSNNRSFLFNFHGRLPVNHDYYEQVSVRRALLQFEQIPDVSVGGFIEEYFEVMGSSHFCLVPEGTSSWTNHLYESFFAGCIPLILSDRYVLPFQDLIDWPSLSIRWPQDAVSLEMYVYVKDLVQNRRELLETMKKRVDAHACWFNFYVFDGPCSPYKAILHDLEKRSANLPRYLHPGHWIP